MDGWMDGWMGGCVNTDMTTLADVARYIRMLELRIRWCHHDVII